MHFIKKIIFVSLAATFMFSFSSCSKDEDLTPNSSFAGGQNQNQNSNQLISTNALAGMWGITSLDYTGTSTTNAGGISTTSDFEGIGRDFTYILQLNDNPKTYSTSGGYVVDLTTTVDGFSFTQAVPITNYVTSGTWQLNGNMLILTDDNTNETSTVEILASSNNNNFSLDFAGLLGKSVQGANVEFHTGTIEFERQ